MKDYVRKNPTTPESRKVRDFMMAVLNIEDRINNSLEYLCVMNKSKEIKNYAIPPTKPQTPKNKTKKGWNPSRKRLVSWSSKNDLGENRAYDQGRFPLSYYCEFGSDLETLKYLIASYKHAHSDDAKVDSDSSGPCNAVNSEDGNTLIHYICKNPTADPMMIREVMLLAGSNLIYNLFIKNKDDKDPAALADPKMYDLPLTCKNLIEKFTLTEGLKECITPRLLEDRISQ